MIRISVLACLLCASVLARSQQITEEQVQRAEAVQSPQPPQTGKFSDDDDYFIAQAQLAGYSIDSIEVGIRCKKAPPELMDHVFRLQVLALYMAAMKSYGNDRGQLSLKGDHEFSQGIQLLNDKIDLGKIARKKNSPTQEQCNAVSDGDYSNLVSSMRRGD